MEKKLDAVTTAPINKIAIKMVGVKQEGHTEIYRDLTDAPYFDNGIFIMITRFRALHFYKPSRYSHIVGFYFVK